MTSLFVNELTCQLKMMECCPLPISGHLPVKNIHRNFYFCKVTTEFIRYTELSLLAEIGGYLGLLMGYSLLNVTKLFQVRWPSEEKL